MHIWMHEILVMHIQMHETLRKCINGCIKLWKCIYMNSQNFWKNLSCIYGWMKSLIFVHWNMHVWMHESLGMHIWMHDVLSECELFYFCSFEDACLNARFFLFFFVHVTIFWMIMHILVHDVLRKYIYECMKFLGMHIYKCMKFLRKCIYECMKFWK